MFLRKVKSKWALALLFSHGSRAFKSEIEKLCEIVFRALLILQENKAYLTIVLMQ